jgi:hypothetical protein
MESSLVKEPLMNWRSIPETKGYRFVFKLIERPAGPVIDRSRSPMSSNPTGGGPSGEQDPVSYTWNSSSGVQHQR